MLSCISSLYTSDINLLLDILFADIFFFYFIDSFFFAVQSLFSLMESHLFSSPEETYSKQFSYIDVYVIS